MNFICGKCGSTSFYMQQRGMQVGLYCSSCGSWAKWIGKKEQQLCKNRGLKIYPQNVQVELEKDKMLGFEKVDVKPNKENICKKVDDVPFDADSGEEFGRSPSNINIEKEVERRVKKKLEELGKKENIGMAMAGESVEGSYCSVCEGNPLIAEGNSKVEVTIFSGVMTVTDPEGQKIYGIYKLKRCPYCGKMF